MSFTEIIDQIKDNSNQSIDLDKFLKPILQIIFKLANNPLISQEEIFSELKISKEELILINK